MTRESILNRSFSTREKVLLLVLVVLLLVALYYFLVIKGVADTMAANEQKLSDIDIQMSAQTALATARDQMESELEQLGDRKNLPEVAVYDNLRNELDELDTLLGVAQTYDVSFGSPTLEGSLVRRSVSVSFTTSSYEQALDVVRSLENGAYKCIVNDFATTGNMMADGSIESVAATLNVTFFETTNGASTLSGLTEATQ